MTGPGTMTTKTCSGLCSWMPSWVRLRALGQPQGQHPEEAHTGALPAGTGGLRHPQGPYLSGEGWPASRPRRLALAQLPRDLGHALARGGGGLHVVHPRHVDHRRARREHEHPEGLPTRTTAPPAPLHASEQMQPRNGGASWSLNPSPLTPLLPALGGSSSGTPAGLRVQERGRTPLVCWF